MTDDWRTLGKAMRDALQGARETILDLKNARGSEAEGTDEEWVADIDAAIAAFDKALAAPPAKPAALDAGEAAKLIANLREGRCDPGPTSDPRECELPDDECDCLMRANAADALEAATRQRDDAREALREIAKLGAYVVPQRIAERALAALSPDSAASGEGDAP